MQPITKQVCELNYWTEQAETPQFNIIKNIITYGTILLCLKFNRIVIIEVIITFICVSNN